MTSPAQPTSTLPVPPTMVVGSRRPAAALLLVGGLLVAIASFVPWVRSSWAAIADEPAGSITVIPGRDLALLLQYLLQTPANAASASADALLLLAGGWGIPLLLCVVAVVALVGPRWRRPETEARVSAGLGALIAAGVLWVALLTWLSFYADRFEVISTTNSLQAGPALALLGYLVALSGVLWLAPSRANSTGASMSRPASTA